MFQVTFSDQSMGALNKLPVEEQLHLMDCIGGITPDMLEKPREPINRFQRDGRTVFRFRAGEWRCYFETKDQELFALFILNKNTLGDFVFRTKLPFTEDLMIEQHQSFWKYLESLRTN
jgi:mRNA interferase RelE/StbE